jgi:CubicO group peptidase (beta-lactamase class C family)
MTPAFSHRIPRTAVRWIAAPLLLLWFATSGALPVDAQGLPTAKPEEVGLSSEKLARIVPAMRQFVDDHKLPGVITLVARRGKVVHFECVGQRDIEADKPIEPDTIFRIYSMTKPMTTAAMMMLYEEGKFKLDDPVSQYIPEFKALTVYERDENGEFQRVPTDREMTIRDLMRHTSGLTYGFFGATPVDKMYVEADVLSRTGNLRDMIHKLSDLPLLFQPGTRWQYSVAVDVQGHLVELFSGKTLDEFFQDRIFEPLKMQDTGFYVASDKLDRFAANYGPGEDGGLTPIDPLEKSPYRASPTFYSGGGGLVSTTSDYVRFCQMMLNGGQLEGVRLLKPQTVAQMTKNQLPEELIPIGVSLLRLKGTGFGLGFSVKVRVDDSEPAGAVGEYGWGGAASTSFFISPNEELIGVAMTQHMPLATAYAQEFRTLVYDAIAD